MTSRFSSSFRGQQKLRCRNGTNVKKQKVRRTTPKFHKKQKTNDVILLHGMQVSQMYTIRTTIRLQNESCATDKIMFQHFVGDQVRRLGKGVRGKVNPSQKGRKVCNAKLILNHLSSEWWWDYCLPAPPLACPPSPVRSAPRPLNRHLASRPVAPWPAWPPAQRLVHPPASRPPIRSGLAPASAPRFCC